MKQKVRFILKNPVAISSTAINMIFAWGYKDEKGNYKPLKYSTGQSVNPKNWNIKEQRAEGSYSAGLNAELASIEAEAYKLYVKLKDDGLTPSFLKSELDIKLGRAKPGAIPKPKIKKTFIHDYVARYIAEMESGVRRTLRNPLKRIAPGTIKNIKAFKTKLIDYEETTGKAYVFNDIDMKFYKHFITWLESQHTINSAGKTIKQLKTIMQAAVEDDIHTNMAFKKKAFMVTTELVDTIYLNDDEIATLYKKELTGPREKARDLFLIGCFTLQRISDWHKINKDNIKKTPNDTKMIKFQQQKTGTTVSIPLVDPWLIAILEKYDYELPSMPDSKLNKYIKQACEEAELDKADQVSSHTARRSGCTNWYMARMSSEQIMKVSGHKTIAEFKKYIRVTDEEIVEELATHKYFKR